MIPVARVGDVHLCPLHGTNAVIEGGSGRIDGRAIAREGDLCACGGTIAEGRTGATLDGRRVAFLGARTSCGGTIATCTGGAVFHS